MDWHRCIRTHICMYAHGMASGILSLTHQTATLSTPSSWLIVSEYNWLVKHRRNRKDEWSDSRCTGNPPSTIGRYLSDRSVELRNASYALALFRPSSHAARGLPNSSLTTKVLGSSFLTHRHTCTCMCYLSIREDSLGTDWIPLRNFPCSIRFPYKLST